MSKETLKRFGDAARKLAARKARIAFIQRSLDGINQAIAERKKQRELESSEKESPGQFFDLTQLED